MTKKIINFYMDDSGTRYPDHRRGQSEGARDWFGLGGILINDADESVARNSIRAFREKWPELGDTALHSYEIRQATQNFRWLLEDIAKKVRFLGELEALLLSLPVIGLACVVDRPGYNHRYRDRYGKNRWDLCKTAFNIAVERAAKYAADRNSVLRVLPERCSKVADKCLEQYFMDMKKSGTPFDANRSGSYEPLSGEELGTRLYDFKLKYKSSPLVQIADLYLWPMCIGGYHKSNRPFKTLMQARKLIDCHYAGSIEKRGIKYSCFERVSVTL